MFFLAANHHNHSSICCTKTSGLRFKVNHPLVQVNIGFSSHSGKFDPKVGHVGLLLAQIQDSSKIITKLPFSWTTLQIPSLPNMEPGQPEGIMCIPDLAVPQIWTTVVQRDK